MTEREHRGAAREHRGAKRGSREGAYYSQRSRVAHNLGNCIYIIYTLNLGLAVAVFVREREQGRFRGSSEGALL